MRKLINTMALGAFAAITNAQMVQVGTYDQDAFIYGVTGSSSSGYVKVQWSGYETPSFGNAGWRVVVRDSNGYQYPIASETYHASANDSNYSRTFAVPPYHSIRVELYAVGDQNRNSPIVSSTVTTSLWVQPISTTGGTYYDYPVKINPFYNNNSVTNFGYPLNITLPFLNRYPTVLSGPAFYPMTNR